MPLSNTHLTRASHATIKNDEFYTRLCDIEKEMRHHRDKFRGKTVWCNCDDPNRSQFAAYFRREFSALGIKRLIATGYDLKKIGRGWSSDNGAFDCDGDFRRNDRVLHECDLIVTNPPFSLSVEHLAQAFNAGKEIAFIGSLNMLKRSDVFPRIVDGALFPGAGVAKFDTPDGTGGCSALWLSTWPEVMRNDPVELSRLLFEADHLPLEKSGFINVNRVDDIPTDYEGEMAVPISFLCQWNREQFDLVGVAPNANITPDGRSHYCRAVIKHRNPQAETERLLSRRAARKEIMHQATAGRLPLS